ncbi:MAG: hypothetical protein AAGB97_00845 [Dehalococcoidia bacterium]
MNLGTKAKTIGMILLAVLLLAIPVGAVLADIPGNASDTADGEYFSAYDWQVMMSIAADMPQPVMPPEPSPAMLAESKAALAAGMPDNLFCEHISAQDWRLMSIAADPPQPVVPPEPPPAMLQLRVESHESPKIDGRGEVAASGEIVIIDGDISIGISEPHRVGAEVHGSAWTRASWILGVDGTVDVWVWLWWHDGTGWVQIASSSSVDHWAPPGGFYYAEATGEGRFISGLWVTTSYHRVWRDNRLVFSESQTSPTVFLP